MPRTAPSEAEQNGPFVGRRKRNGTGRSFKKNNKLIQTATLVPPQKNPTIRILLICLVMSESGPVNKGLK